MELMLTIVAIRTQYMGQHVKSTCTYMQLIKTYLGPWRRRLRREISVNVYSSPLCVMLVVSMKAFTTGVINEVQLASRKGAAGLRFQQNFSSIFDQSAVW